MYQKPYVIEDVMCYNEVKLVCLSLNNNWYFSVESIAVRHATVLCQLKAPSLSPSSKTIKPQKALIADFTS